MSSFFERFLGQSSPSASAFRGIFGGPPLESPQLKTNPHPYYPIEAEIVGYLANSYSVPKLLSIFAAACVVILGSASVAAKISRPTIRTAELLTIMWFVLSGTIHLFFEGYFAYNHKTIASQSHLFAQLWKEYAYSDSRYLTSDPFVLCMETVTAVAWGPLSFVVAYFIATDHPMRHPLQIVVSLGQAYGDVLYYVTSLFNHYYLDISYWRPEPYYFWTYYVLMNFFWIVIPGTLIYNSFVFICRNIAAMQKAERSLSAAKDKGLVKANGHATSNGDARKRR